MFGKQSVMAKPTATKLSPELRELLRQAIRDKEGVLRRHAIGRFERVETMAARLDGLNDEQADELFERMLDDAEPGTEPIVSKFIEAIKAARSAKRH
jgi:hypothetical protein